ncbi:hypothetical protein [Endozoicomonas sp. YOMI1]|uniref:hypothetical protein n=1 Tax=Endozoicomonas sp. YOMI1 TaxID=2828739 RepID=UPI0021480BD5|nr:hypothetical protein [Endozoicomonas sp. YOMI1]
MEEAHNNINVEAISIPRNDGGSNNREDNPAPSINQTTQRRGALLNELRARFKELRLGQSIDDGELLAIT